MIATPTNIPEPGESRARAIQSTPDLHKTYDIILVAAWVIV